MPFKIKDLMINVLPSDPQLQGQTELCRPLSTLCPAASDTRTTLPALITWLCTTTHTLQAWQLGGVWPQQSPEASAAALAALKEELKQQLAEVEKQQAAAEASLNPQSVEEVDMLTNKLNEALKELKARRTELDKKPKASHTK